jgi:DNA polymerase V
MPLRCFAEAVPAGFPSPAQGYEDDPLDLNQLCIKHPAATYFARMTGDSLIEAGMYDGDILIVDRSLKVVPNAYVVASIDGEFTCKQYQKDPPRLEPRNTAYPTIYLDRVQNHEFFGVVTGVLRLFK